MTSKIQIVRLPSGKNFTFHPDRIPCPSPGSPKSHSGFTMTSGPVGPYYFGAVFEGGQCIAVCGPAANGPTALVLAERYVERTEDADFEGDRRPRSNPELTAPATSVKSGSNGNHHVSSARTAIHRRGV